MTAEMEARVLKEYQSNSNPGKKYHIIDSEKGPYCDCMAWRFSNPHTCKHLENYLRPVEPNQ